ncbi:nucleotidyltransferase family protein [Alteromonas sp. McT4-15]|uniref:nucleotidyltransferase domain-containing protein n=1 Tax=Alteromonas sp. McT4-15 TaxID=2881256 RepID=UPI001CF8A0E5|nr:nucleotidyltransferase family protein [Alteromonas sp. McT4-15]MCB4436275.1 nucleotidyltransferase family protein [Alteromonas sp. McT4-15]
MMSSHKQTITEQAFIDAVLNPASCLDKSDAWWSSFIKILRFERLLALFAFKSEEHGLLDTFPSVVRGHLENARIMANRQADHLKYEVSLLSSSIQAVTPQCLYLKGAAYCLADLSVAKGRLFSDIDVLVPKNCLEKVEKSLLFKGWMSKPINDYDERYYREWAHEIPPLVQSRRGTVVDIHHNLVPPISGKAPDINAFLAQTMEVNGVTVLKPHAMLVHSCIHLIFNETFKQAHRDLYDIASLIADFGNDDFWDEAIGLAKETGFYRELFLACRYSSKKLGFPLPSKLTQDIPYTAHKLFVLDSFMNKALSPHHPLCDVKGRNIASFMAWVRGHWCKMPLMLLIYHLSVKSIRALIEQIFGKHVFETEGTSK